MKTDKTLSPKPAVLWALRLLALAALALSAYLAWATYGGGRLIGCGPDGAGCAGVMRTRWSVWFGLPVLIPGSLVYAAIAFLLFRRSALSGPKSWSRLISLTIVAAGSGLWFIGLQFFVIKGFCPYCTAIHGCGLMLAVFTIIASPRPFSALRRAILIGLAGTAVLPGGQLAAPRGPALLPDTPPLQAAAVQTASSRDLTLAAGRFKMKLGEYPVSGNPDAPRVVVLLFDYTCPDCRRIHSRLLDDFRAHENRAVLVWVPVPLDASCNPGIQETAYVHRNGCGYAKIGLAVWKAKPEAYPGFDRFMFDGEFPPSLSDARMYAERLVGRAAIDAALVDPHFDELITFGVQTYFSPFLDRKILPTFITPEGVLIGPPTPEQLNVLF